MNSLLGTQVKQGLTKAGPLLPASTARMLNAVANFVATGRMLRDHGLVVRRRVDSRFELFDLVLPEFRTGRALYLEFGVFEGETVRYWASHLTNPQARFVGFDSFEGLPERWTARADEGFFSTDGSEPVIDDPRVTFVKGWFTNTLPQFEAPSYDRLFLNVDSDLYASAKTVLQWSADRLRIGDYLYFDEFHDRLHEGRAFVEFLDETGFRFDVVGSTRSLEQIVLRRSA